MKRAVSLVTTVVGLSLPATAYAENPPAGGDSSYVETIKDTGTSTTEEYTPSAGDDASYGETIKDAVLSTIDMPPESLKKMMDDRHEKLQKLGKNLESGWTPGDKIYRKNDDGTYTGIGYVDNDLNPVETKFTDNDENGFDDQLERFATMGPDKDGNIVPYGHWTDKGFAVSRERVEQLAKAGKLNKIQAQSLKSGYYDKPENQKDGYVLLNNPNIDMNITSQELLGAFLPVGKDGKLLGQTADFLVKKQQAEQKSKDTSDGGAKDTPADKKLDKEAEKKALEQGWN